MGDPNEVVCKYEKMEEWKVTLENVNQTMEMLVLKSAECQLLFQEAYVGDALTEVNDFFDSLIEHLYRLSVFYTKMAQFIDTTNTSFSESDTKMTENMGG